MYLTPKKSVLAAAVLASSLVSVPALAAEIEANIGVTSDYIWRGMTQNSGYSSISGGVDVDYGNGFYAGTWVGDVSYNGASYELDLYAGFAGERGAISYDVGYLMYMYPDAPEKITVDSEGGFFATGTAEDNGVDGMPGYSDTTQDLDFSEVYVTLGTGPVSLSYYHLVDADGKDSGDDTYISVGYEAALSDDWTLGLSHGIYAIDGNDDDGVDTTVSLSKGDFSIAFVTTSDIVADADEDNSNDDDLRVAVSWGTSF